MFELHVLGTADLRRPDATRATSVLAQPKRFAVLAYLLLAAPGTFVRRDTLLALFWPESDETRARTSLRKALHYLRQSLGAELIVGHGRDDVAVDMDLVDCDALRLRAFASAGRLEDAVTAYGGELLPGFHIDGSPAFEQWLESERASLRRVAAGAAATLAAQSVSSGDAVAAAAWQRRAHEIAPHDQDILRTTLVLLLAADQRSSAIELLDVHRRRLDELGIPPDAELDALFERTAAPPISRSSEERQTASAGAATTSVPVDSHSGTLPPLSHAEDGRTRARVPMQWLISAAAAILVIVSLWQIVPRLHRPASAGNTAALIAVGAVRDFTDDGDSIGRLIPDLLATNLARAPRMRVVSAARLHEIAAAANEDVRRASVLAAAARAANADELIEGSLYSLPDDRLRLDLRRLRLSDGELLDTYRVTGGNPFELVDRATAALAMDVGGVEDRRLRVADVTTLSLVALRFYQEGLDAYFNSDAESAQRMFEAALAEDTTFAMAAYFASRAYSANGPVRIQYLQLAERLSHRTTDRERLLIRATLAFNLNDPRHVAIADSLVSRYPDEPAAQLLHGRSLMLAGRFAEAIEPLRQAVRLDSMTLHSDDGSCRACEALLSLGSAYLFMDSTVAAERTVRRAFNARAKSSAFASSLASALQANGKYAAADEHLRRAGEASMSAEHVAFGLIGNDIRRGEFARADAALRGFIGTSARNLRSSGRWLLIISLRNQGRLDEALRVVEQERNDPGGSSAFPAVDLLMEATIRFERGDFLRSAVLFDSLAASVPQEGFEGSWSRNTAWNLTHAANAWAAAGRLDRLETLADRVRVIGARSGYGRDPRLHHHVRGLLAAARGDHTAAISEFRAAIYSISSGYTRTNVELARSLIAAGQPAAAAAVLDPPLRNGGLESTLYYATRTEMQALLGEAWIEAGRPDLARPYLDQALKALKNADPSFDARVQRLRELRERAG